MNEKKISVIIPMYNSEKYIAKCLDSIISQNYKNLEVIVVNDGSKDSSREICEEYVKKDSRIKLINTENRGAGSARNTGFEASTGEIIGFIDSDDYVCNGFYERLSNMLETTNADIAIGRFKRVSEQDIMDFQNSGEIKEHTNIEQLMILYGENVDDYINSVLVTNKLFRRKLFDNNTRFPIHRLIDDEFIIYKLIDKSKKIAYTDDVMYAYVQSNSSVMRTNFKAQKVYDTIDVYDEVYDYFKGKYTSELDNNILIRYLGYCVELAQKTKNSIVIDDKNLLYKYLQEKFEAKLEEAKEKIEKSKYEKFYNDFYEVINNAEI